MGKYAQETDSEDPCPEGSCYEVSVEGAIGFCPGAQFLTRWLFYPAMDEKSISDFVDDLYSKLDEIKAEDEAAAKAEAEAKAPDQPAAAPAAKFCPNCGTPYEEDAKFCMKCGTPRQ
ncbi:MAG: zinc ribbon domain-containing protein [Bacteroidales bacterium]|nr:zinc ribbon domain-containing protein [Bacteroidales bacterium]